VTDRARLRELAGRLVASGPKAGAVSASECHEISEGLIELLDELARPRPIGNFGSPHFEERQLPRDTRQEMIETFQACGGDAGKAHELVTFVFGRDPGEVGQELGGVAVTVLALAGAAGLSADEEEAREIHRVLSRPLREFTERNASKNAAGFKIP
jgi:NTP pyrophosphatase (non-canonical NTP hydrolase)